MSGAHTPGLVLVKGAQPGAFHIEAPGEGANGGTLIVCSRNRHSNPTTASKLEAYAERIVQCVNAHDGLVEQRDELAACLRKFVDCNFTYFHCKVLGSDSGLTRADVERARAALAATTSATGTKGDGNA